MCKGRSPGRHGPFGFSEIMMRCLLPILAFTILAAMPARAAEKENFLGVYRVSIFGLSIAESRFTSHLNGNGFRVKGNLRSAGLARIFDKTDGITQVTGHFAGETIEPVSYKMSYKSGSKRSSTAMAFENGRVVTVSVKPKEKRASADWVPVNPSQLVEVTDPLTASMVKATSLSDVCNRTLRVFDGEMRADLQLSYLRIRPFSTDGYRGDVVDCSARFVPVAGYRKTNSTMRYLQTESRITISFAPLGDHDVYAPVKAEVGTKIGTVRVYATRFGPAS
jgi:hypothetical protein